MDSNGNYGNVLLLTVKLLQYQKCKTAFNKLRYHTLLDIAELID